MRLSQTSQHAPVRVPKWLPWVYAFGAVSLVPWIVNLRYSLPRQQTLAHWNITWVGIDVIMLSLLVLVVYLALKRSGWLSLALAALATLNLVDGWFDVLTSTGSHDTTNAIVLVVLVEIPWAILSIVAAVATQRQLIAAAK